MPFTYQAMLILLAFLVPIAGFFMWANRRDRRLHGSTAGAATMALFDPQSCATNTANGATMDAGRDVVRGAIRDAVEMRGITQLAEDTGLPRAEVAAVLDPRGRPTHDAVMAVLHALGYQVRIEARSPSA